MTIQAKEKNKFSYFEILEEVQKFTTRKVKKQ